MISPFYKTLFVIFTTITILIFATSTPLKLHQNLLLVSNACYLVLSIIAYKIMMRPATSGHKIINQMLAGTMLRLFVVGIGMGIIIYIYRMNISKINYAFLFLMYIIYTSFESKYAIKQSKQESTIQP